MGVARSRGKICGQRVSTVLRPHGVLAKFVRFVSEIENAMANAFWVSVRNNISKRWNTTENDVSKNQSSADSAIRPPNTSILNSNAADITEYFLDVYQTTLY
ncbi:hypothetical protein TNCV_169341 [Trichonephila clavipes]|nr:hypothetical protein TNCV_169341 [Trichonephila clavipes]